VELEALVTAMQIVELTATTRSSAIRELVEAVNWADEGVCSDDVVAAIEEREATAHTIIGAGLALPHAMIEWNGDFRIVLGRSRPGVDYLATGDKLHLLVLLVVGNKSGARVHLEVLASVAELLNHGAFRQDLVQARDVSDIKQLLVERAGWDLQLRLPPIEIPRRSIAIVQQAVGLAESLSAQALLLAMNPGQGVPWEPLISWPGRVLLIAPKQSDAVLGERPDTHLFEVPHASLSRMDRANLGLLLAAANGLVDHEREVVCITGPRGHAWDSITVTKPAAHFRAVFPEQDDQTTARITPAVILRVLSLAIELASEGREAHPIGVMFVMGDTRQVLKHTQQLVLNPFHGFARRLRNILDPSLTETVKEFAMLDGAFIVEVDGSIRSAGTYLIPRCHVTDLPGGLGARHQAAAAITTETQAIAVTVSQSTGTVTLFQDGNVVLTLERAAMTRW
jgi:DNA integrity scanning protein DisA with diadenylate cyclase activity/mannitol/fructose-specific phosphotransferase system IIA component (Ntr-type)